MRAPGEKYGRVGIEYLRRGESGNRGNSRLGEWKGFWNLVRATPQLKVGWMVDNW